MKSGSTIREMTHGTYQFVHGLPKFRQSCVKNQPDCDIRVRQVCNRCTKFGAPSPSADGPVCVAVVTREDHRRIPVAASQHHGLRRDCLENILHRFAVADSSRYRSNCRALLQNLAKKPGDKFATFRAVQPGCALTWAQNAKRNSRWIATLSVPSLPPSISRTAPLKNHFVPR